MVTDSITKKFLKKKPAAQPSQPVLGGLDDSSIFEDEEVAGPKGTKKEKLIRDPKIMAAALDPDPKSRTRWERKMVIREIRKRGRMSRTQKLKQQERELLSKSHNWRTSTKKLMLLARQIQGKTMDDAITQMRFSGKKSAKEVRYHLEHARNEAIVRRGMGLGMINGTAGQTVNIQTKEGKRLKIEDQTRIYIDQAWVGKGDYTTSPEYRARGRVNMLKHRTSHISVILKEEATRVRLHKERQEKEAKKKVWTQLPNRPITAQRPYYSW